MINLHHTMLVFKKFWSFVSDGSMYLHLFFSLRYAWTLIGLGVIYLGTIISDKWRH